MKFKFFIIALPLIASCQSVQTDSAKTQESSDHLKVALLALDHGDQVQAEGELKAALSVDPTNSRAITTLSSVYALEAGISLNSWLDPFWESARQLDARLKYFESSLNTLNELTDIIGAASTDQQSTQARLTEIARASAQAALALSVLLDIFQTVPYLDDAHMVKLDLAITTLRVEGVAPQNWDEEQRVYLAILSMVRLINHVKRTVGDSMYETKTVIARLCNHTPDYLSKEIGEIKKSLRYMEEGLVVGSFDPPTSQREGRKRFQEFISKALTNKMWDQFNDLFDGTTQDGKIAELLSEKLCKKPESTSDR